MFHQSKLGRDVELQITHLVLFKSPRDVLQTNTLSQQLGLGSQLKKWYQDATSTLCGHLLIELTPDIAQTVVQFHQNFIYQQEQKQSFWTMSIQYVSILFKNNSSSIVQKVSFNSSANV